MRQWLKDMRDSTGFSQCQVAAESQMTKQAYGMIESGKRRPSPEAAKRIAAVLGFDWVRFFEAEQ